MDTRQFEDDMDESGIFTNAISGNISHHEAYNTVMDFGKMDKFLNDNRSKYTLDEWRELKLHFADIGYLSPINTLIAIRIRRKLEQWES
jgi:hypothetical protein